MSGFSQDAASDNIQDNALDASGNEIGASITGDGNNYNQSRFASTSKSIIVTFGQRLVDNRGQESVFSESISTFITISNGNSFVPSLV